MHEPSLMFVRQRAASACVVVVSALMLPIQSVQAQAANASVYELPFDWKDDHGDGIKLSQFQGQTVMLTMGYSSCRETCSFTLHRLEQLQQSADRAAKSVQVVVVSYDPSVDSPATWTTYRHHHHVARTNWHFLTGDPVTTKRFAAALKFPYWLYDEHLIHDYQILLIGPDGRVAKTLTWANHDQDFFAPAAASCGSADSERCHL